MEILCVVLMSAGFVKVLVLDLDVVVPSRLSTLKVTICLLVYPSKSFVDF